MKKQEHYFVMCCFVIVIGLLIFYRSKNNCRQSIKWNSLDVNESTVENFEPPTFKAASDYSNIVVADDQGNLTTTSLENAVADGLSTNTLTVKNTLKVKDWSISQTDNKLCFSRNGVAKQICLTADVQSNESNALNNGSGIKFGDQEINETKWKKIDPMRGWAGWAIDGRGSTSLIFEGSYLITSDGWGDSDWINDTWDLVYVNKGWEIQLWKDSASGSGSGTTTTCKNTTDDLPKRFGLGDLVNQVSFVKATWVGY